jgi:hypothetical protein
MSCIKVKELDAYHKYLGESYSAPEVEEDPDDPCEKYRMYTSSELCSLAQEREDYITSLDKKIRHFLAGQQPYTHPDYILNSSWSLTDREFYKAHKEEIMAVSSLTEEEIDRAISFKSMIDQVRNLGNGVYPVTDREYSFNSLINLHWNMLRA